MSEENEITIMCFRLNSVKHETAGTEAHCTMCNAKVWLSDSTVQGNKLEHPECSTKVVCVECILPELEKANIDIMVPSFSQMEELKKLLKK